jgi:hypothetical protein
MSANPRKQQIPPLRFAPVGMTKNFRDRITKDGCMVKRQKAVRALRE